MTQLAINKAIYHLVFVSLLFVSLLLSFVGSDNAGVYYLGPLKLSFINLQIAFYALIVIKLVLAKVTHAAEVNYSHLTKNCLTNECKKLIFLFILIFLPFFAIIFKNIISGYFLSDDFINLAAIKDSWFNSLISVPAWVNQHIKFFRPLAQLSRLFNFFIFGLNPVGYHIINILNHLINSILACLIVYYLFFDRKLAFFVGALFATMPIQSEAVVFISGNVDLLASTFYFSSFLCFIFFRRYHNGRALFFSFSFFLLTLLTKEIGISLPFLIFGYDLIYFSKEKKLSWKGLKVHLPFILTLPFYLIMLQLVTGNIGVYQNVQGYSRIFSLTPFTFIKEAIFGCFVPFFFPINWLIIEHLGLNWLKYAVFVYSFIIFTMINLNCSKVISRREAVLGLLFIFVTSIPIAGLGEVGESLIGSRWYYLIAFGFYLFICAIVFGLGSKNKINFFKGKLDFIVLSILLIFNCLFLTVNNLPWEKAGRISYSLLKQTKLIFYAFKNKSNITIFFNNLPDAYYGAFCFGQGINEALFLNYGYNAPAGVKIDNRGAMINLRKIGLGEKSFVLKWDDKNELIKDITSQLNKALSKINMSKFSLKEENIKISNPAAWDANEEMKLIGRAGQFKINGMDSFLTSQAVFIPAASSVELHLNMKVAPSDKKYYSGLYAGKLFWTTGEDLDFNDERFVEFWIKPDSGYHTYVINFISPDAILNSEVITQLKLFPACFPSEVDIKEIKLTG